MARITRRRSSQIVRSRCRRGANRRPRRHPGHRTRSGLRAGDEHPLAALGGFRAGFGRLLKGQITQECKKATGITLKVETINANDLQARITSAIQSGAGADIIMALGNWPQLYAESSPMSATWPRRSARPKAATTSLQGSSPRSATSGSACRGPSAAD